MKAQGFAVVHRGRISVATVSPTERAAKVNALVVLFGVSVMNSDTDAEIERAWQFVQHRNAGTLVVPVQIEAAHDA
jgi:hypothetical protein